MAGSWHPVCPSNLRSVVPGALQGERRDASKSPRTTGAPMRAARQLPRGVSASRRSLAASPSRPRTPACLPETLLQRLHEVHDLGRSTACGRCDLLAAGLALDRLQQYVAIRVVVALEIPVGGQRVDELQG